MIHGSCIHGRKQRQMSVSEAWDSCKWVICPFDSDELHCHCFVAMPWMTEYLTHLHHGSSPINGSDSASMNPIDTVCRGGTVYLQACVSPKPATQRFVLLRSRVRHSPNGRQSGLMYTGNEQNSWSVGSNSTRGATRVPARQTCSPAALQVLRDTKLGEWPAA